MKSLLFVRILSGLLIGAAVSSQAVVAHAMPCPDDTAQVCQCAHGPVTLPGLPGAPEWNEMSSPADGFWRPELNDPRWSGAPLMGLTYASGTSSIDAAQARVLSYGDYLYVMVQVLSDDEGPGTNDAAFVGFSEGSASKAWVVRAKPVGDGSGGVAPAASSSGDPAPQDNPLPEPTAASGALHHWESDASGSFASSTRQNGAPTFVDNVAVWKPDLTGLVTGDNRTWAITLRINKNASGHVFSPGSLRIFLGASVYLDAGGTPATVSYGNAAPATSGGVGGTVVPAAPTTGWVRYAELGTACTAGISISSADIGVFEGTPPGSDPTASVTQRICAKDPCPSTIPNGNPRNIFRATARNIDTSAGLAPWEVRARFRYADWGSTVANRKYGPWKDIATIPVASAILTGPDTDLTTANGWYWQDEADGAASQTAVIDFQCALNGGAYCPTLSNTANLHQCMMVELGVPPGINRELGTTAVYQNMNFVPASTVDRTATISIEGLKDMTGVAQDRVVYLYVQTENMPRHQREPLWLPSEQMAAAANLAQHPVALPLPPSKAPVRRNLAARVQPKVDPKQAEAKRKGIADRAGRIAANNNKLGDVRVSSTLAMSQTQLLDAVWPTYRVRPYYDTGRTHVEDGVTTDVLEPLVPFGLYLSHQGPFYGFNHAIQAADPSLVVTKLSEHWYKLSIKSEGVAHIRTIVTAEEKPAPPGGSGTQPGKVDCEQCKAVCKDCQVKPGPRCNCRLPGGPTGGAVGGALALLGLALLWSRRRSKRN